MSFDEDNYFNPDVAIDLKIDKPVSRTGGTKAEDKASTRFLGNTLSSDDAINLMVDMTGMLQICLFRFPLSPSILPFLLCNPFFPGVHLPQPQD